MSIILPESESPYLQLSDILIRRLLWDGLVQLSEDDDQGILVST